MPPFSRRIKRMSILQKRHCEQHGNRHKNKYVSHPIQKGKKSMESTHLRLVEETSALIVTTQIEAEFAKDRWDARNIPGLRYLPHGTAYYIDFLHIPDVFRPVVKDYIKCQLAAGRTAITLHRCTYCLGNFFTFFSQRYPHARTLQLLSTQDIDAFITSLKADANARGFKDTPQYINHHVIFLEGLLSYLE